ncbi:MAG: hypothetical protein JXR96_08910 [Deltaproteobacteria bacterium]|nr:hypothetical protein [Deltaproteobacteria bacterium]
MTLEEIRKNGIEALYRTLGPVGMVRFLQQFETGHGDYSSSRREILGEQGIEELAAEIRKEEP